MRESAHLRMMTAKGEKLLEGAIDMHVHPLQDGEFAIPLVKETVNDMKDADMSGVLFKPHFIETTMMANYLDHAISDFRIFGGLIMERSSGGIDPHVVRNQIDIGAKKIWMPLMTENFWEKQLSHPRGYLNQDVMETMRERYGPFWSYLDEDGKIREEIQSGLREVLNLIADANVIFDTGHASAEESVVLVEEAKKAGVEKIVVDHPLAITKQATIEQQKEMAEMGAYMEQSWAKMQPTGGAVDPEEYAEAISAVGPENTVLVTDYGAGPHPLPSEAMREYIVTMKQYGISDTDIRKMISDNPRELLDIK